MHKLLTMTGNPKLYQVCLNIALCLYKKPQEQNYNPKEILVQMSKVKSTIGFLVLIIIDEGCGQTLQVGPFPDYSPAGEWMTSR